MTWLLLDAGNTALKWALTGPDEPRALARGILGLDAGFAQTLAAALQTSLSDLAPQPVVGLQAIGCSVASETVTRAIEMTVAPSTTGGDDWLTSEPRFEYRGVVLVNGYRDPRQLGADRWHAMIAARHSFPGRPLVVVCAGTATKGDSVDAAGRFLGLLLLNLAVFGWLRGPNRGGGGEPARLDQQVAAERIRVLTDREVQQLEKRAGEAKTAAAPGLVPLQPEATVACVEIGEF